MIPIPRDFREFLRLLNRHRVKYPVVGGYAVASAFQQRGQIVRIGREPMRLEMLNESDGVIFADCYARRTRTRLDNGVVSFVGYDDRLRNKRSSNPPKDQADVVVLEKNRRARRND